MNIIDYMNHVDMMNDDWTDWNVQNIWWYLNKYWRWYPWITGEIQRYENCVNLRVDYGLAGKYYVLDDIVHAIVDEAGLPFKVAYHCVHAPSKRHLISFYVRLVTFFVPSLRANLALIFILLLSLFCFSLPCIMCLVLNKFDGRIFNAFLIYYHTSMQETFIWLCFC